MLVLNRTDKSSFSVGEGNLTAKLVQLYKRAQVSTSGLLHDSCVGFGDGCWYLWGGCLFSNCRSMWQSTAQMYGKVQRADLLLIL